MSRSAAVFECSRNGARTAAHMRIYEPEVDRRQVVFRWDVTPPTPLYTRSEFRLTFPPSTPIERVPRALWWRLALLCLHTHWALLRPCTVELPVGLGARERELWLGIVNTVIGHLEAYGGRRGLRGAVELLDAGPRLDPVRLDLEEDRAAVSFSGGKDSLAVAALLAELTPSPLLVTTTSPVPWARDHVGSARQRTLAEIGRRLAVEPVEVYSDWRTCWELGFANADGCRLGTHEVSDLPLYQAVTIATAAAHGVARVFMASEAELQYNAVVDGALVLHPEFSSCAPTQELIGTLLAPFGMRQASLLCPLHTPLVQALLLRRYPHVSDLQFSCWQAPEGMRGCGTCAKCRQIALMTLAEGVSPSRIGIDPIRVLRSFEEWRLDAPPQHRGPRLHPTRTSRDKLVRALQSLSSERVAAILSDGSPRVRDRDLTAAVASYDALRQQAVALVVPPDPGFVEDFLRWVPDDLRAPLRGILEEHFTGSHELGFGQMVDRGRALVERVTAPVKSSTRSPIGLRRPAKSLNLCILCRDFGGERVSGLAQATRDLAEELAAAGHHVALLTGYRRDRGDGEPRPLRGVAPRPLPIVPLTRRDPPLPQPESARHELMYAAAAYREVRRVHQFERPVDAVLAPHRVAEAALCVLDERFPTVVSCTTSPREMTSSEQAILSRARYLHGITDVMLRTAIADFHLTPLLATVIGLGLHDRGTLAAEANGRPSDSPRVLFAGRSEPDVRAAILREANAHPVPAGVRQFGGPASDVELRELYRGADIVCIPSGDEVVLIEAMMSGKAIVVCDAGGLAEVVRDGRDALIASAGDTHGLARAIRRLVLDAELRTCLGKGARARYEERFQSNLMASQMSAFVEEVVERHERRPTDVRAELTAMLEAGLEQSASDVSPLADELLAPPAEAWVRLLASEQAVSASEIRRAQRRVDELEQSATQTRQLLDTIISSRSWRLTHAARRIAARLRAVTER